MMGHKKWMELTAVRGRIRSSQLKVLDEAIRKYERQPGPATKASVKGALDTWKQTKGAGWKTSIRNRKGAVELLMSELDGTGLGADELAALAVVEQAQRESVKRIFQGAQFKPRKKAAVVKTANLYRKLETVANSGGGSVGPRQAGTEVQRLLKSLFDHDVIDDIAAILAFEIGPTFMGELASSVTPFVGHAKDGATALYHVTRVAQRAYQRHNVNKAEGALRTGDPTAAAEAIRRMIKRKMNHSAGKATIHASAFAIRTLPGTSAAGAVTAFGDLSYDLYLLGREYKEMLAANQYLRSGQPINHTIFDINPLLGAYYLAFAETSTVLNLWMVDIGQADFKDRAEKLRKKIEPAVKEARTFVRESRFIIPGRGLGLVEGKGLQNAAAVSSWA